jgi:hypothetical protein
MFRLDGGKHGIDPAGLALALVLDGGHAVEYLMGIVLRLLLNTATE